MKLFGFALVLGILALVFIKLRKKGYQREIIRNCHSMCAKCGVTISPGDEIYVSVSTSSQWPNHALDGVFLAYPGNKLSFRKERLNIRKPGITHLPEGDEFVLNRKLTPKSLTYCAPCGRKLEEDRTWVIVDIVAALTFVVSCVSIGVFIFLLLIPLG